MEAKSVHIRKSTLDTKRATCALTLTASEKMWTPTMVYTGAPDDCIEKHEFQ